MIKKIIIAIDGHSSTGKSTLAKMLSEYLGYRHINTGSMYRAVTLHAIRNHWIDNSDNNLLVNEEMVIKSIDNLTLKFLCNDDKIYKMYMNGEDVDNEIKNPNVSQYVSQISAYPTVREKIVFLQKKMGELKGVVMEGRDIGSVVFPNAELKLFVTASIMVRAKRRHAEMLRLGLNMTFEEVLENLKMRDLSDSQRKHSPLIQVKDAILIDNTLLDINEQFHLVISVLKKKKHIS